MIRAEELELCSIALDPTDTRVIPWLAEGGGIGGKEPGIHSNWLRPYARVQAELEKILAMVLQYQQTSALHQERAIEEMVRITEELGLYE